MVRTAAVRPERRTAAFPLHCEDLLAMRVIPGITEYRLRYSGRETEYLRKRGKDITETCITAVRDSAEFAVHFKPISGAKGGMSGAARGGLVGVLLPDSSPDAGVRHARHSSPQCAASAARGHYSAACPPAPTMDGEPPK